MKSIFWPTVQNAWDVDYLGRQGFWICLIIAVIQLVVAFMAANPVLRISEAVSAVVFLTGAMGVREKSWPAAALVFSIFFVGLLYTMASGRFPGILMILAAGILLSNVRAAFLASEWKPAAEGEDQPTRFDESLSDRLVDQLPAKAWPVLQIPFFGLASIFLLLSLFGLGSLLLKRYGIISHPGSLRP